MDIIKFSAEIEDEFFSDLVVQITKDFTLCGLEFDEKIENKQDLISSLHSAIVCLSKQPSSVTMGLLYRIDVKQENVAQISQKYSLSFNEAIVVAILHRELQKVRFRKNQKDS